MALGRGFFGRAARNMQGVRFKSRAHQETRAKGVRLLVLAPSADSTYISPMPTKKKTPPTRVASTESASDRPGSKRERHVALLRGINVGGKNMLPMAALSELFLEAGCRDVRTYIQSGNVVFSAPAKVAARIAGDVSAAIAKQFKLTVPVVIRSAADMEQVAQGNPFLRGAKGDTSALYVAFLADKPDAKQIAVLDPNRSPGDEYKVVGGEIYMNLSTGAAKTKLTNAYFDSKLDTISTARNWNTVLKLVEMTRAIF